MSTVDACVFSRGLFSSLNTYHAQFNVYHSSVWLVLEGRIKDLIYLIKVLNFYGPYFGRKDLLMNFI